MPAFFGLTVAGTSTRIAANLKDLFSVAVRGTGDTENKQSLAERLECIESQATGIKKMVDREDYCIDIRI